MTILVVALSPLPTGNTFYLLFMSPTITSRAAANLPSSLCRNQNGRGRNAWWTEKDNTHTTKRSLSECTPVVLSFSDYSKVIWFARLLQPLRRSEQAAVRFSKARFEDLLRWSGQGNIGRVPLPYTASDVYRDSLSLLRGHAPQAPFVILRVSPQNFWWLQTKTAKESSFQINTTTANDTNRCSVERVKSTWRTHEQQFATSRHSLFRRRGTILLIGRHFWKNSNVALDLCNCQKWELRTRWTRE